jgi:hypothetical protein
VEAEQAEANKTTSAITTKKKRFENERPASIAIPPGKSTQS